MNETSYLIASKVLDYIKFNKTPINTPLKKTYGLEVSQPIVIIPILRAGLGLVEGFIKFLPNAEKGHIGLYRDEQTYKPVEYLFKLPKIKKQLFIVLDPMLATGNSSLEAVNLIVKSGVKISNLMLVSLLCAPEGIKTIEKKYPKLRIFTTSVDKGLDNNKFIVPGLGDAGDRYMGT